MVVSKRLTSLLIPKLSFCATQDPDGSLKEVDVLVDSEVELLCHPVPGLGVLLFEVHDEHGVERVDDGQAESEPVLANLGDRTQVVVAPGKASIGAPSMLEGFNHSLLSWVGWTGELNGSSLFIFGHFASSIALLFLIRTLVWKILRWFDFTATTVKVVVAFVVTLDISLV